MSLLLSPHELARLVVMPGVTDEMAQIFHDQPLFILGLRYFTYTSQHIDRLEREVEQARREQAFLFDRIVEDGFEQKIRPLVIRNHWRLICCRNRPYATTLSSNSDESEEPLSTPSSQAIDEIVRRTIPLRRQRPTRIPILSIPSSYHTTVKPPLGSKENPIIVEDDDDFPNEGRTRNYRNENGEHVIIPFQEGPKEELNVSDP